MVTGMVVVSCSGMEASRAASRAAPSARRVAGSAEVTEAFCRAEACKGRAVD